MIRFVAAALLAAVPAFANDELEKWLTLPLSPGAVAILAEHGEAAEVQARWREALKSPDAEVRAAVGRAVYAAGATAMIPALKEALVAEQDPAAAAELVRAIGSLGTSEDDAALITAGKRLPLEVRTLAWTLLGRKRSVEAFQYLPAIREGMPDDDHSRRTLVRAVTRGGRTDVDEAAAMALEDNDAEAWNVVWNAFEIGVDLSNDHVAASIQSPHPRIRAGTYWNLAIILVAGSKLPEVILKALDQSPEARVDRTAPPKDWDHHQARFAYELVRRARRQKRFEDLAWAQAVPPRGGRWALPGLHMPVARLLTKGERKILVEKQYYRPQIDKQVEFEERFGTRVRWRQGFGRLSGEVRPLHYPAFPKRYVTGLADVTGCRAKTIYADVTYAIDARPATVALRDAEGLSEGCARAARIVAASHPFRVYARWDEIDGRQPEPGPETIEIAMFQEDVLALAQNAEKAGGPYPHLGLGGFIRVGGDLPEPKKVRDVKPKRASMPRFVAPIVLDVVVGVDGKVQEARRPSGSTVSAEIAAEFERAVQLAIETVRQWVYEPPVVNGKSMPVIFSVDVEIAL